MLPSVTIPDDLAEMIGGPSLMIASVRDDRFRATVSRGTAMLCADGSLDIFLSAAQWSDTVAHARPARDIALTFCNPSNYRCWQVKGQVSDTAPATPDEAARCRLYLDRMVALLDTLGVSKAQVAHLVSMHDLHRIRVAPREVFNQTPGAGAGNRIAGGRA